MWLDSVLIVLTLSLLSDCQQSDDPDKLLDWCLDAKHHKTKPGPEGDLYSQCTPWKQRSCCTSNTTREIHHANVYNFDYNHCGRIKNMSEDCRRHFKQDLCFYECSPNIGPWVVKVTQKIRRERFYKVPLCRDDCDSWFNACVNDYTCTNNWATNWDWSTGINRCLPQTTCKTFKEIFRTADNFCQQVWDDSWSSVANDQPCMRLWFNETSGNPNDNVARLRVEQLAVGFNGARRQAISNVVVLTVLYFVANVVG